MFPHLPSGKRLHNYGKIHPFLGKSTISMPICNSFNGMFTRPGIPFRPAMKKGYPHGITPKLPLDFWSTFAMRRHPNKVKAHIPIRTWREELPALDRAEMENGGNPRAQRARTVPHLCLADDTFNCPEKHLDRIWLDATQVGYFSNPLDQFDGKQTKYVAPEMNSVTRGEREKQALEGWVGAFTYPTKTKQQRVEDGRKNKRDALDIPSFRWRPVQAGWIMQKWTTTIFKYLQGSKFR